MLGQLRGNLANQLRCDQWFVTLHIHHDHIVSPSQFGGDFRDAVGAGNVMFAGHHGIKTMCLRCLEYLSMIGCYAYLRGTAFHCLFGHPYHHGLACDIEQRFSR
jgi:hypothetical protein